MRFLAYCTKQTQAPVALFKSLEHLLRRADLLKPGLLGISPSAKKLSQDIKETKDRRDSVADKISRLKLLQNKLERRLTMIAKKGAISIVSPGCGDTNKLPEKIIL